MNKLCEYKVKNKVVYHGSTIQGLSYIVPTESFSYKELGPIIFGSTSMLFASSFCLKWRDCNLKLQSNSRYDNEINKINLFLLQEMDMTKPCSIYELDGSTFKYLRYNHDTECVSKFKQKVLKEHRFSSFKEVIDKFNIGLNYSLMTRESLLIKDINKYMKQL